MANPLPTATPSTGSGAAWSDRADALARRVNIGWCFDQLVWALPTTAAVATAVVVYLRLAGVANLWVYLGALLPLSVACVYSWLRARRHFIGRRQALVRLDSSLHLDAALSSAAEGVVDWPAVADGPSLPLKWRWERSFLPALLSILLVITAIFWPLPITSTAQAAPSPKPRNIAALETILDLLRRESLIAENDLTALESEIEKLGEGQESLYNPSTLEAADYLAKSTSEALSILADSSASASQALQAAIDPTGNAEDRATQAALLEAAVALMAETSMKPPAALIDALNDSAATGMGELDSSGARMLEELLERNQDLYAEMLEQLDPGQFPINAVADRGGNRDFGAGDQPATGDSDHRNAPPEELNSQSDERGRAAGQLDPLAPNPSTSAPGELVELRAGRPPEPESPSGTESAGLPYLEGTGGGRLWKENFDPDEQRFLGEFYR